MNGNSIGKVLEYLLLLNMEGLNFPLLQEELPREFFAVEAEDEKS